MNIKDIEQKINLYLSALEQDECEFIAELETFSVAELEKMAGKISEQCSDYIKRGKYGLLTRLLEFVLTFRKLNLDRQFDFNQENINKISSLDKQLNTFFAKREKDVENAIAYRTELMKHNQDIQRFSVGMLLCDEDWIEATNISSFMDIEPFRFFRIHLYWSLYDSDITDAELDKSPSLLGDLDYEQTNEFPFFNFSSRHELSNQIKIKFATDNGHKTIITTFDTAQNEKGKCTIGEFLYFIHKYSLFSLSDILCVKEIHCYINDVQYHYEVKL